MKKKRFPKLGMIYAIIKGRTVVYNANISKDGIKVRTEKSWIVDCHFDMVRIKNKLGEPLSG